MRIGILVPWGADFEEKVKKVRSLGFVSGQVSMWDMAAYNEANAAKMKAVCEANNFEITSLWCGWSGPVDWYYPNMYTTLGLVPAWLRNQRMRELMDGAAFGRLLGVKDIVTHIGYIPDNPFTEDYQGIANALKTIGTELKKHGQRLLFETGEELPVTLVQMMKSTGLDNLGVNLDPANLILSGRANAVEALTYFAPYFMSMHAKDALRPEPGKLHGEEVPIGQGHANFPALFDILKTIGYDGEITIEREGVGDDVWEKDIAAAKAYLEALI
ncbi:MAG: sugar phosphate isomerase/epimerase [Oscillospiraceae bacterium]|nr:sugar phosphate isomerase/epimerase [Oscillospiraceae bacterium]